MIHYLIKDQLFDPKNLHGKFKESGCYLTVFKNLTKSLQKGLYLHCIKSMLTQAL